MCSLRNHRRDPPSEAPGGKFLRKCAPPSCLCCDFLGSRPRGRKVPAGLSTGLRSAARRRTGTNTDSSPSGSLSLVFGSPPRRQPDAGWTPPPPRSHRGPPCGCRHGWPCRLRGPLRPHGVSSLILHPQTPQSHRGHTFGRVVHGHRVVAPRDPTNSVVETAALVLTLGRRDARNATVVSVVRGHRARLWKGGGKRQVRTRWPGPSFSN